MKLMIRCLFVLLGCVALSSAAEPDRSPGSWWYTPSLEDLLSDDPKVVVTAILNEPEDVLRRELVRGYFRHVPIEQFATAFNLLGKLDEREVNYDFEPVLAIFAERDPERAWEFVKPYFKVAGPEHYFDDWDQDLMMPPADWRLAKKLPFVIEHGDVDAYLRGLECADLSAVEMKECVKRFYMLYWSSVPPQNFQWVTDAEDPDQAVKAFLAEREKDSSKLEVSGRAVNWMLLRRLKENPPKEELAAYRWIALMLGSAGDEWMILRHWLKRYPGDRITLSADHQLRQMLGWHSLSANERMDFEYEWVRQSPEDVALELLSRGVYHWMGEDGKMEGLLEVGFVTLNEAEQKSVIDRSLARLKRHNRGKDDERPWHIGTCLEVLAAQDPIQALNLAIIYEETYGFAAAMVLRESFEVTQTPARLRWFSEFVTNYQLPVWPLLQQEDDEVTYIMEDWGDIDVGSAARAGVRWVLAHPKYLPRRHLINCWSGKTSAYDGCMDDRTFGCLRKWSVMDPEGMSNWAQTLDDAEVRDALLWMVEHPKGDK